MNKSLSAGILFILSIVLLYLGGVSKGVIGAGLAVGGLVCLTAAIIGGIKNIANKGKKDRVIIPSESNAAEPKSRGGNKYERLEKKRGWRVAKVAYWVVVVFAIIFSSFHVNYYENYDMQGFALFIILICIPLFMLYRKVAQYIVSGD